MDFEEAVKYLKEIDSTAGIKPGLERVKELLGKLGDPQDELRTVHVAGTNGKGSVCRYISCALEAAGYKTGLYTSPSVFGYCEKIQINGEWIGRDEAASLIREIASAAEEMEDAPSAFEIETAMAFLFFLRRGCDFVVIETGMGGLLDATNVIERPEVSVITSVAMDHSAFLGNTIAEIARNKGGIIKKGCPAVFIQDEGEAFEVLREIASEMHSEVLTVDPAMISNVRKDLAEGQFFDYKGYCDYHIRMLGRGQTENAVTAIEALRVLQRKFPEIDEAAIREGLASAVLHGRFDVLCHEPVIICDGAHNPAAAENLISTIREFFTGHRVVLIMGIFKDKDHREVLRIMSEVSGIVITFTPENARGLDAYELAVEAGEYFPQVIAAKSHRNAVSKAVNICGMDDVIVHMGSLSTIAEFEYYITRMGFHDENRPQGL